MKKIIIMFFTLILVSFLGTSTVLAAPKGISFDIKSNDLIKEGQPFTIDVAINQKGITDGKIIITYDDSKIKYKGGELKYSDEKNKLQFTVNSNESGKLIVVWASIKPMKTSGTIFTLDFIANESLDNVDSIQFGLDVKYANDDKGNNIAEGVAGNTDNITIGVENKNPNIEEKPTEKPNETESKKQDQTVNGNTDNESNQNNDEKINNSNSSTSSNEKLEESNDKESDLYKNNEEEKDSLNKNIFIILSICFIALGFGIFKYKSVTKGKGE